MSLTSIPVKGVEVLSTYTVSNLGKWFVLIIAGVVSLLCLFAFISFLSDIIKYKTVSDDIGALIIFFMLFAGSAILSIITINNIKNSTNNPITCYECIVNDDVSFNELTENYEIVNIKDRIITVKEKHGD